MLPPPPFLVFTTGLPGRVADAFQMDAVDYLLKPLDPEQVTTAVNCLLVNIRSKRADLRPQLGTRMNGTKIRLVYAVYCFIAPEGLKNLAQGFNPGKHPIKRFALKGREMAWAKRPSNATEQELGIC